MEGKPDSKASDTQQSDSHLLSDSRFLRDLRRQMCKFAALQLSNSALAEDTVQEALLDALKNARSFGGRAALKTWVFTILKNKIANTLRLQHAIYTSTLLSERDNLNALFNANGRWYSAQQPVAWANPEAAFRTGQFWRLFEACLDHLPAKLARVFMMHEFIGINSHEICVTEDITACNLNDILYRARLRLCECLEKRWFLDGGCSC